MTPEDAKRFLRPKWTVVAEKRGHDEWVLELDTGQVVLVGDDGSFHVSGKGWKSINTRLHNGMWPSAARVQSRQIKDQLLTLGLVDLSYFNEGLNCIQFAQAPRAAVVLGWSGFMDLLYRRFLQDLPAVNAAFRKEFAKLHARRGDFSEIEDFEELRDKEALKLGLALGLFNHSAWTQLDAMRDERNGYAHVGRVPPDILIALGFFSRLVRYLPLVLKPEAAPSGP